MEKIQEIINRLEKVGEVKGGDIGVYKGKALP